MQTWDVIVVGGGPGGAMAARTAAASGLDTLLFERGRRAGEKNVSGCGLGPRLWRDFPFMEDLTREVCPSLREGVAVRNYFVDRQDRVAGMIMSRPTESVGYEPARRFVTMNIYRSEFDAWLATLATEAGARLISSTLITDLLQENGVVRGVVDEAGRTYRGRVVIGADGAVSTVAARSGLRRRWRPDEVVLIPQLDFEVPPANIDRFMGEETLAAWWGVRFPAAYQVFFGDGFHIGLGNWLGWWERSPVSYLERVVRLPYFQRLVDMLQARPREFHVHLLPWLAQPKRSFTDNVMLVGDAAGFACPLEAEGVYPAMITGRLAGAAAAEAIADGDTTRESLARYEVAWRASSAGVEFETGRQLVDLWRVLPFSPEENMDWFVPLVMELVGGVFDWSEPHAVRIRQIVKHVAELYPRAEPVLEGQVLPLLVAAFRDELDAATRWRSLPRLLGLALRARGKVRRALEEV